MPPQGAFVIVEKDLLRGYLDITAEYTKGRVIGYKLCVVEDWVLDNNKGFCCFLEPSHDPQDSVVVDIVRPKNYDFILATLQSTLQKAMVQQFEIKLDAVKDTLVGGGNAGNVVGIGIVCSGPASSIPTFKNLSLRYLDNSEPQDYESNRIAITYLATLRCLGCTGDSSATHNRSNSTSSNALPASKAVHEAISRAESIFRRSYKSYTMALSSLAQGSPNFNAESIPHAVESIIKDVKMALVHLHYLPFMTKIDGVFTTALTSALAKFQADYNAKWDMDKDKHQLIPTGLISPECITALLDRMMELKKKLDVLGFKTNDNKPQQTMSFPSIVRLFNERAKTDTRTASRRGSIPNTGVPSTTPPSSTPPSSTPSSGPNSGGEERERDPKDKQGAVKITDEDRALLENISTTTSHVEMKKKAKERKNKKEDPIEKELRRKLSLLSNASAHQLNPNPTSTHTPVPTPAPPPPPPPASSYDSADDTYVVCERERFARFAQEHGLSLGETEVLVGYRLYVVEEWMSKSSQLWSVVEFTGHQQDKILATAVSARSPPSSIRSSSEGSAPASPTKRKALASLMHHPSFSGFYSIHTPRGQMVLYDRSTASSTKLTLIPIPDGNFDAHISCLQLQITLHRFGCSVVPPVPVGVDAQTLPLELTFLKVHAPYLPPHMEVPLNPPQVKRTLAAATELVCEVQAALCHLNYLPLMSKIDGILDTRTVYAIKAFQKDHSHTAPDGKIDIGTYRDIRNSVVQLSNRLASLGFTPPYDPVRSYHKFNKLVKSFQTEYGAYPEAPGRNVLQALDKLNLGTGHESSGLSIRGAKGVEQYLPTTLPLQGNGCVSFIAKASDNIIIVLTSTHPTTQQIATTEHQTLQGTLTPLQPNPSASSPPPSITYSFPENESEKPQSQNHPFLSAPPSHSANNSPSLSAYPVSPALHPNQNSIPTLALSPLDAPTADHQPQQIYQLVIGSGNNSVSVLKRSVAGSPMIVCCTTNTPQAVVSPLVWDTYWVSVDSGTGWIVFGKGEIVQENILLKYRDNQPLAHVNYIGLSCWDNPVDFSQIRIGPPVARDIIDEVFISSARSTATEDEIKEITRDPWHRSGASRSLSTSPLPQRRAPSPSPSPSPSPAIASPPPSTHNNSAPNSAFSNSSLPSSLSSEYGYLYGGERERANFYAMENENRVSPVAWDENVDSEEDLFSDEDKYGHKASEEKELLKAHIIKLTEMLAAQKENTQALQEELADLTVCYTNLKEESIKAAAKLQANERLLKDMNEKYNRAFQVEIADILDRLSANSHSLQTYNVKIKRLDDIVQDVHKKNARNLFTTILYMLLTWVLALVAFIAMGITTITNSVRTAAMRLIPPPPTPSQSHAPDPAAELSLFVKEQKAKIDKFMGDLKED
eukprot:Phypoly_transcript_00633.p1 GENE.Phypoly_transcript_00633~~Phypoly_transcript_00633.p1  ORF type:complete len:1393 (+),score=288.25 Phypoly_transcript_00633:103-4281(+)